MVIEREITLSDIVETGTIIDASISAEMIGNIFYEGAPLHDLSLIHISSDAMATEQAYYALTAYHRFTKGQTALYDMSDVK